MATRNDKMTVPEKAGALQAPGFLNEFKGQRLGQENVDNADITLPRLGLCQDLTPQRKKTNSNYIEGLDVGQLFNSVTTEIYGESIKVIPLFFGKQRIWFEEMGKGGGILCSSADFHTPGPKFVRIQGAPGQIDDCEFCEQGQWKDGVHPLCGNYFNFVSLHAETLEPIIVSFKSTGLKVAKQWNALIRLANLPTFAKVYTVQAVPEKKNNNDFFQYKVKAESFVSQEQFEIAKSQFEALKDRVVMADTTGEEAEAEAGFNTQEM